MTVLVMLKVITIAIAVVIAMAIALAIAMSVVIAMANMIAIMIVEEESHRDYHGNCDYSFNIDSDSGWIR